MQEVIVYDLYVRSSEQLCNSDTSMSKSHPQHIITDEESPSKSTGLKTEISSLRFKMDQHKQVFSSSRTPFSMPYKVHLKIKE